MNLALECPMRTCGPRMLSNVRGNPWVRSVPSVQGVGASQQRGQTQRPEVSTHVQV